MLNHIFGGIDFIYDYRAKQLQKLKPIRYAHNKFKQVGM